VNTGGMLLLFCYGHSDASHTDAGFSL
jgi:hypothetical protein